MSWGLASTVAASPGVERELRAAASQVAGRRPILEGAGVSFQVITNHETLWTITP
jgi:hypothetical protein